MDVSGELQALGRFTVYHSAASTRWTGNWVGPRAWMEDSVKVTVLRSLYCPIRSLVAILD
jgi:hypothetical protein